MYFQNPLDKPVSVVIAEDQIMTAEGLAAVLEKNCQFKVLAISPNGEHLIHLLNSIHPDLILLDLNMPVMDGLKACKVIREKFPQILVVALTMFNNAKVQKDVKQAGAHGMLLKYSSSQELIKKLQEILGGTEKKCFVTNNNEYPEESVAATDPQDSFLLRYKITKREFEIIRLIAKGVSTEAIAEMLFLSAHTITTHRRNILGKLNLNNSAELIDLMHANGLLKH